uniref:Uncharacterized protein n=1 Tax=Rhizophora mucronata TaxID=61149 RepID=A0A2P2QUP6_RHIMU
MPVMASQIVGFKQCIQDRRYSISRFCN